MQHPKDQEQQAASSGTTQKEGLYNPFILIYQIDLIFIIDMII